MRSPAGGSASVTSGSAVWWIGPGQGGLAGSGPRWWPGSKRLRANRPRSRAHRTWRATDGSCLKPDAVSAIFQRRVRRAGLPALTLKGLRHTWATLALERGIHPRVVQERLGHSTIAITLGIYSHVAPTLHDEAAQAIAQEILTT